MYDFSDVEPQQSSDLIPDGTFAKVTMTIRPGGVDGQTEIDKGPAQGLDHARQRCAEPRLRAHRGRRAKLVRRKFWHPFTVSGGKVDEKGASIGWNITKRTLPRDDRQRARPRPRR